MADIGGLRIFRKKYIIRRFEPQEIVKGYATATYEDVTTLMNVQPLDPDELQALPEGERQFKRLKAFGDLILTAADQDTGIPGDWLFYCGKWYKCVSSVPWDHTMLAHCRSEFSAVGETDPALNLEPPKGVIS